jgi:hypothetical protein
MIEDPNNKVNIIFFKNDYCITAPKRKSRCKEKAIYGIYNGDGEPKISRLFATPCKKHLHIAIKNAWEDNKKLNEEAKKQAILRTKKLLKELRK